MASSDESLTDSDDDMIVCHVCLTRFDSADKKPKYLDCHHYFCLSCIQGFSKDATIICPTCRHVTTIKGRQAENLATNHTVLRLVDIALDRARELAAKKKVQQSQNGFRYNVPPPPLCPPDQSSKAQAVVVWCVTCSSVANVACHRQQHIMCDCDDVVRKSKTTLEARADKCCEIWDKAIADRQRVQSVYDSVLLALEWLQADIRNRIEVNDFNIAQMEAKKQESRIASVITGNESKSEHESMIKTMASINKSTSLLDNFNLEANRCLNVAQRLLENISAIEDNFIHLSFSSVRPDGQTLRPIELLQKAQLSFSGAPYKEPLVKGFKPCVTTLSFMILKLAEEQSKQCNNSGQNNNQIQSENRDAVGGLSRKLQMMDTNPTSAGRSIDNNEQPATRASSDGYAQVNSNLTFRDSLLSQKTNNPSDEWKTVSKPVISKDSKRQNAAPNKCFFRLTLDGVPADRIVFQLDPRAPVMVAKFIEMCTNTFGYQGSRIYKNYKGEGISGGSKFFYTRPDDLEGRKDLFLADRSEVEEKRGSIRFQVKLAKEGRAQVSTDFQIILSQRTAHHKCTTVFGQVVEGLEVLDEVSGLNLRECRVFIAECGIC